MVRMSPNFGLNPRSAHCSAMRGSIWVRTNSLATMQEWRADRFFGGVDFTAYLQIASEMGERGPCEAPLNPD
jgi:hypothetical protein